MSADNFYLIRRHPQGGGYAVVMGFASSGWGHDEYNSTELEVDLNAKQYSTIEDALEWALGEYSEYGVSIHPECEDETHIVS